LSTPQAVTAPGAGWNRAGLEEAVMTSLIAEVDALKPGNVHRFAGGHGMTYEQFITSAEVSAPLLCEPGAGVGRRILNAVTATRAAAGTNTNLGMLLLFAPIVTAAERASDRHVLQDAIKNVLAALHKSDAEDVFEAIRAAGPGGLGHAPRYDVHFPPDCSLLAAMAAAADRDLVARQYQDGFEEVFALGLTALRDFERRWQEAEWATVGCYLRFLARFPDSHVQRKHGAEVAERIRQRSEVVLRRFEKKKKPGSAVGMLLEYDKELKDARVNPGTSADLTAASLLVHRLGN
jgi:triphosphoribosyl-dephospho-CoA synthase